MGGDSKKREGGKERGGGELMTQANRDSERERLRFTLDR